VSVLATVVTAPLVVWMFGRLSLVGPLTNVAASPVIALLQPMLFLALAAGPVHEVAQFVAVAAHPLLVAFDWIATVGAAVPFGSLSVAPSLGVTVACGATARPPSPRSWPPQAGVPRPGAHSSRPPCPRRSLSGGSPRR